MEESIHYGNKTLFPHPEPDSALQRNPMTSRGKPFAHFLFKALFFALIIVVVPLFPSQAPEFVTESLITKFWELIHLLFIGIAVSYGLFCRRNVETGIETESKFDSLQHDMSRMFHVSSSGFEDGYGTLYGFGEKRVAQGVVGEIVDDEEWKLNPNFSYNENGSGISNVQAWNSRYFQGESMLVVARPNCGFGEFGGSRSGVDYKPLGLPVRSLRSKIRERESSELVSGSESGSGSIGSYNGADESGNVEFGSLGPRNLEHKFDEAVVSPSPIPWRSRSGRTEMREKPGAVSRAAHFRPLSVDETQFESLRTIRTPSLRSTVSFSSHASSMSSSQEDCSPSRSVDSEVMDSKVEDEVIEMSFRGYSTSSSSPSPPKPMKLDARKTESYHGSSASSGSASPPKPVKPDIRRAKSPQGSSASGSPSPPKLMDDKGSTSASQKGYSLGSLYENDLRSPKNYLKELSESGREDLSNIKESKPSSLKSEVKPASLRKTISRGKSVRTIRSSRLTAKTADCGDMQGYQVDNYDVETAFSRKETKRNEAVDIPFRGNTEHRFDHAIPVPKHTSVEDQPREMKEFSEIVAAKSEEEAEIEAARSRLSSVEDADSESVQGTRASDSNEVDKKAGEFIAKFREQIRLQKVASMERSKGLQFGSNYFR